MRNEKLLKTMCNLEISMYALSKATGIPSPRISGFRNGRLIPDKEELDLISDHLHYRFYESDFVIDKEMEKRDKMESKINDMIKKDMSGKKKGFVKCPKCRGKIFYHISDINGYMTVCCKSKGCFFWISSRAQKDELEDIHHIDDITDNYNEKGSISIDRFMDSFKKRSL